MKKQKYVMGSKVLVSANPEWGVFVVIRVNPALLYALENPVTGAQRAEFEEDLEAYDA